MSKPLTSATPGEGGAAPQRPPLLSFKGLCDAEAHPLWNCCCLPLVLLYNSLALILLPTLGAYAFRLWSTVVLAFYSAFAGVSSCLPGYAYLDMWNLTAKERAKALGDYKSGLKGAALEKELEWVRAPELAAPGAKPMALFEGRIEASDLLQGSVGDCWLVSALAVLAENPAAIRACIRESELSPRGIYHVRLYDGSAREWVEVVVDDLIPVKKGTKSCHFMKPHGSELWAILLEKAFAKFVGSYATLDGNFPMWAWHAMTGDNCYNLQKDSSGGQWTRSNLSFKGSKRRIDCGFEGTSEKVATADLHGVLAAYKARKSVMGAWISPSKKGEREHKRTDGLVEGHAYSVLDARVVGTGALAALEKMGVRVGESKTHALVRLRNPWGSHSWTGDWGRGSSKWEQFPDVAKELKYSKDAKECVVAARAQPRLPRLAQPSPS